MLKNGTDAEFTCMAHANDVKKLRYSFQLTDESLSFPGNVQEPNFDAKDIDHLTTLHINGVNKENEGQYNCTIGDVKNPMHPDVKNITKFNVSVFGKHGSLYYCAISSLHEIRNSIQGREIKKFYI